MGEGHVLITTEEGQVVDIVGGQEAGGDVQRLDGVLTPGLVNCHCHLELSHLKGLIPKQTGMIDFLLAVMQNRFFAEDVIGIGMEAAKKEMLDNGIVAVGDICNTADSLLLKRSGGLRYHNFIEATGFIAAGADARFGQALNVYRTFADAATLVGPASVVPHAPYSVSPELFSLIDAHDPRSLLTMHNQESRAENEFFSQASGDFFRLYDALSIDISGHRATGRSSLSSVVGRLSPSHSLLLVHNVYSSPQDIEQAMATGAPEIYWCFCPQANLYINNVLPDINLFRRYQHRLVLGTDSLASNDELNIVAEMRALQQRFNELPLAELLGWATLNGARALRMADTLGSFEKGKLPGVALIEGVDNGQLGEHARARRLL